MKLFFTSDWHLNHVSVLQFDQRPFDSLDHMREGLIARYNATVPEDGVCFFLGDNSFGSSAYLKDTLSRLNGTKVAILGNHDKGMLALYQVGFSVVLDTAKVRVTGNDVTLSHCPLRGVHREDCTSYRNYVSGDHWHGESRNQAYSLENKGQFHLHGHIHAGPHNNKLVQQDRQWDVGVAGNNYTPVSYAQVAKWIVSHVG